MGLNALKKAATKKTATSTKKKSGPPEFKITDETLKKAHGQWLDGKIEEKNGKAKIKKNEGLFLPTAIKEHMKACQENDEYFSSIKAVVEDEDGTERKLTVSFANRYSKIAPENEDAMRAVYGDDYDRYFREKAIATLSEAAVNDEEFIGKITDILGDKFDDFFKVQMFIEPKKDYHERRMTDKILAAKHKNAIDSGLVVCNKPSVKQG